jgi:cephalosporin-C deacetylase-like acetyl esterase/poly(3-hydroxybutyrate) depolymerase
MQISHSLLAVLLLASQTAFAQKPDARIKITTSDDDGLVAVGDSVTFSADIRNLTGQEVSGNIEWLVHTVAYDPPETEKTAVSIAAGETGQATFKLSLPVPGFADVECRLTIDGRQKPVFRRSRIGANPEKVHSRLTRGEDFGTFWNESLAELKRVDPQFEIVARPDRSKNGIEVFEVSMHSLGDVRVRGWLEVPKTEGPHPVVIRVPGYGQNMKPIGRWKDMIAFSFNPRGHGNSQQDVSGEPRDYWVRGLDDKNAYFYRGAYLDCVRAVEFVCSRDDVDQKRIAVWGGSQGGGFALATAALDSRVDYCVADIPFLCDWHNYFRLTQWPEMNEWIAEEENRTWENTLRTMSYFDTMNLCDRIKCPTLMGVGLQDQVCPPTTSFAAFNQISGRKSFRIYANRGHGLDDEHWLWVWKQLRSEFGVADDAAHHDTAKVLESGEYSISQSWSQEKDFKRPYYVSVPDDAESEKLPVFIFLHGNGGNGKAAMTGFMRRNPKLAKRYVMVFPDGYAKSWNIVSERSKADDRGFIEAIVGELAAYDNLDAEYFTIMGSSNGGALVNQLAIESKLPSVRNYISSVSPLNVFQHDGKNFKAKSDNNNYQNAATPMTGKRLMNISGTEDRLIPYRGGPSKVIPAKGGKLAFVDAEESIFLWAREMGYEGEKLTEPTAVDGKLEIFSYLGGDVIHYGVVGEGHGATRAINEQTLLRFMEGGNDNRQ